LLDRSDDEHELVLEGCEDEIILAPTTAAAAADDE